MTTVETRLARIERLLEANNKPKWVPAFVITEVTGWNSRRLQTARENSLVEFKENGNGGYLYNLSSLHPYLLIKKTA